MGKPELIPENTATVLGYFAKIKEKEMEKKYEFYPMMTKTLKNIVCMSQFKDYGEIMGILLSYPDYGKITESSPMFARAILDELDRQYARWQNFNKKGE